MFELSSFLALISTTGSVSIRCSQLCSRWQKRRNALSDGWKGNHGDGDLADYTMSNRSTWQLRLLPSVVPGASVLKATGISRSVTGSRSVIGTELTNMSF